MWELVEGYGEKGNILRSKLEGSLQRNCIGTCECNLQSYTFLFIGPFANSFLEICNGILLSVMKLTVTKGISSDEN